RSRYRHRTFPTGIVRCRGSCRSGHRGKRIDFPVAQLDNATRFGPRRRDVLEARRLVGGVTAAQVPSVPSPRAVRSELGEAFAAGRTRLGLVSLLFLLAAPAWWSTAHRMAGMDVGPGANLGTLGWFVGVWVVMMAAMMVPSVSPTVALYAQMTRRRGLVRPLLFSTGYLFVWGLAGV